MSIEEYWDAAAKRHGIDNQKKYGFERPSGDAWSLGSVLHGARLGVEQGWTYKLTEDKNALWEVEPSHSIWGDRYNAKVRKVDLPLAEKIMTALQEAITEYQQANAS